MTCRRVSVLAASCALVLFALPAHAATLRVCASGCPYTDLQRAIDDAAPGDTILLRAGESFQGPFVLRAKSGSSTAPITIRSDAPDADLPGPGVRLIPLGRPGGNTSLSRLARLLARGGSYRTTPVISTAPGARHYVLRFLHLDPTAQEGWDTVVALGDDRGDTALASDIVLDRVYIHGHPRKGQKRGIALNGARIDVLNSYIADIKTFWSDAQAIAGWNGPGPYRIVNNFLEGAAENVLFGGADPARRNLVPSDIEIRRNHFSKPTAWRNPILATPGSPAAAATSASGSLAAGTHYFRIVAVLRTGPDDAVSAPSQEVSRTLQAGGGAVALTWQRVPGAERYRIYRGTRSGGQDRYMVTSGDTGSFTYTGAGEVGGAPRSTGHLWNVKNLLELKNAQRVIIEGNLFEYNWAASQNGYAILLTPRNQDGTAPWTVVQDVTFTNNILRHSAGGVNILGYDTSAPGGSQITRRITFRNNLFDGIDPARWGGNARLFQVGAGVENLVVDRNTFQHRTTMVIMAYSTPNPGFVYTNNLALHGEYGVFGSDVGTGLPALGTYFPGAVFRHNVLAGGRASLYPTPNAFPSVAEWEASFVDFAGGDYRLRPTSPFYSAGANGSVPGADLAAIAAAMAGSPGTPPSQPTPPPPPGDVPGPDATGDILLLPAHASRVSGRWAVQAMSNPRGSQVVRHPDAGAPKLAAAAAPADYFEMTFRAEAGTAYQLWILGRADGDHWANDSVFVQFSGSVTQSGSPKWRIGTTAATEVNLEECSGCGLSGWAWRNNGWGSRNPQGESTRFAASGPQTIRVQTREDGLAIAAILLSPVTYRSTTPPPLSGGAPAPAPTNAPPVARPGGPYAVTAGTAVLLDGTASSDPDGVVTDHWWSLGDEILLRAAEVPPGNIVGSRWVRVEAGDAGGGVALHNPDRGEARPPSAAASPGSYVEVSFYAAAGVPYHFWMRMRAESNSWSNDSVWVQFSGAVDAAGRPVNRIGTTQAASVILEEGHGAGVSGWGWNDASYGGVAEPIYFATSGLQTLRLQQREDGVMWDQIVLSSARHAGTAPGRTKNDTTILPDTYGIGRGATFAHRYVRAGVYPVVLTVRDDRGAINRAVTSVTVRPAGQ